jgi:hypothetical protein
VQKLLFASIVGVPNLHVIRLGVITLGVLGLGVPAGLAWAQPSSTNQPAITPPGQTAPSKSAPGKADESTKPRQVKFQTADELLTALETADATLRTLTADLTYDRTFALQGDRQVRRGRLYFVSKPTIEQVVPARRERKFAIEFNELYVGTRQEKETKFYIFDGIWLVEKLPEQKVFVKRQIVPAGQPFDALKIGEGPLPIPIGQRKSEILSRFNAELLPAESGLEAQDQIRFVKDTQQLRLTPRPELERDSEFLEIRLWYKYDADGALLPRMARTVNQATDESVVQLLKVKVNGVGDIPVNLFDTQTPPDGWDVKVQEWRDGPENVEFVNGPQVLPAEGDGGAKAAAKDQAKEPARTPKPGTTSPAGANPGAKPAEQPKEAPKAPAKPAGSGSPK